jgi:hypothetical protein
MAAPWERGRLARRRPLRVHDSRTPASRLQRPSDNLDTTDARSPPGRRSAGVSPAFQRTAGAAATRVRLLAAHGSAAISPAAAPSAPGSRRSRACRARRRGVADRRHAADTTIADAALRDDAATRLRGDGKHGDGSPLFPRSSFLVPRSSFLAAVFLMSAPTAQDRVHESVALYTPEPPRRHMAMCRTADRWAGPMLPLPPALIPAGCGADTWRELRPCPAARPPASCRPATAPPPAHGRSGGP